MLNKEFLKQLDNYPEREIYARILALNFQEMPLEQIEGKVTSGSINIDGASAIRRTCSLSLVAKDLNINEIYWGLQNKFKLEIGIKNFIDEDYPDIIWFPQGVYVITGFNTTQNTNNYTVSISGKDKMCLLNGDIGGNLAASVDFGVEEYWDRESNIVTYTKIPIKTIIREMIHTYALEPYHNIIINDLEDCGFELLEYRGEKPLYLWYDTISNEYVNAWLDGNKKCWSIAKEGEEKDPEYTLNTIPHYDNRIKLNDEVKIDPTEVYFNQTSKKLYTISKVEYGQTIGYRMTDLVYAGDLISNIGETLTSVLDKIKNMLGNFEYFYDLGGRFVFQRKKTYVDTPQNGIVKVENDIYVENSIYASPIAYQFDDGNLISSYQNNPNLSNLKNDYSVWGTRKGISGAEIPIHYRYAIDKKPVFYKALDGKIYTTISDPSFLDIIKEEKRIEITQQIKDEIRAFRLKREVPEYLEQPYQKESGEWTGGWWDIRDFHDYYQMLTGISPNGTMKWYSQNDQSGCIPLRNLPGYNSDTYNNRYVWLIIVQSDGTINIQHGSGNFIPAEEKDSLNTYYESYIDSNGKVITERVYPLIQKPFASPYSGCNDNHTYLSFLKSDVEEKGGLVYFYNPNFPFDESFEKMSEEKINQEFEKFFAEKGFNVVDWREIIYQMAKDFYKHNQEDNFLIQVANNNKDYYPTGITGYEQYYIDIEGFWRQLYNPEETGVYTEYSYITSDDEEEFIMPLDDEGLEPKIYTNLIITERNSDYDKKFDLFTIFTLANGENEVQKVIDTVPISYNFNIDGEQIVNDMGLMYYVTKDNSISFTLKNRIIENDGKISEDDYKLIVSLNWGVEDQFILQENKTYLYNGDNFESFIEQINNKVIQDGFSLLNREASLRVEKKELYCFINNEYISLLDYYLFNNKITPLFTIDFAESSKDCISLEELFEPVKNIIYNTETGAYKKYLKSSKLFIDGTLNPDLPIQKRYITYYTKTFEFFRGGDYRAWNKIISTYPDQLDFWFDFLDSGDYDSKKSFSIRELDPYAVNVIGDRPKVVNNSQVTSIYFREVPNLIYLEEGNVSAEQKKALGGYQFIQNIPINLFSISAQGKSAYEELQNLLYNHSYCIESITLTSIPIYYLEPNTRVSVHDKLSEIYGEYIISKISIPLTYNGMMSITATKAPVRLL